MTRIVVRLFARAVLFSIVALPGSVQAQSLPELDAPAGRFAAPRSHQPSEHSGRSVVTAARRQAAPPVADGTPAVAGHRRQPSRSRLADLVAGAARVARRRAPAPRSRATPTAPSAPWSNCRAPSTSPSCCRTSSSTSSNRSKDWIFRRWRRTARRACRKCRAGVYETDARPERRVRRDAGGVRRDRPGVLGGHCAASQRAFKSPASRRTSRRPTRRPRTGAAPRPRRRPAVPGGHPGHKQ